MKYFGTDGIRGPLKSKYINKKFFEKLGRSISYYLKNKYKNKKNILMFIGRDTRSSGIEFVNAFINGVQLEKKIIVHNIGIVPTAVISYTVKNTEAFFGAMITASHNPATDNGIKLFNKRGIKINNDDQSSIEKILDKELEIKSRYVIKNKITNTVNKVNISNYLSLAKSFLIKNCLSKFKIVVDMANGATIFTAKEVLSFYGAELIILGDSLKGENINKNCGSEHPELMIQAVKDNKADLGIAFDGDGDRLVICDENGKILVGEEIMAIVGVNALKKGELQSNTLVTTHQSNLALDDILCKYKGRVSRVEVGDRNVVYKMLELNSNLGGEPSGHFIFQKKILSGDGLIAALYLLKIIIKDNKSLSNLRKIINLYPQLNRNINVDKKIPLDQLNKTQKLIQECKNSLGKKGRILMRYSGTENKIRLLIESENLNQNIKWIEEISYTIKKELMV